MTKKPTSIVPEDDLAKDLLEIVNDSKEGVAIMANNIINQEMLMMKLVSYVTRRDYKVYNHAYQLGKKAK